MASITTVVKGDSYEEDFVSKTTLSTSIGFGNWAGSWAIVTAIGTTPIASGTLTRGPESSLVMELRIHPVDTLLLTAGTTYKLIVRLTNTALNFSREIVQRDFKVTTNSI